MIKEKKNQNHAYRGAVLDAASHNLTSSEISKWVKVYKKASTEAKPQIIRMLSKRNENSISELEKI